MKSRVLAAFLALAFAFGSADSLAASRGPRLYILDCGDIKTMDPTLFGLRKEEIGARRAGSR